MTAHVSVSVSGDEAARARLAHLAERAGDLRPGWEAVFGRLRTEEIHIFSTDGYGAWPANSPRTVARKGHDDPLVDTGRLNAALTGRAQRGGIARKTPTSAVFGVNDRTIFWARFVGAARRFMVSEQRAASITTEALLDHLEGRAR